MGNLLGDKHRDPDQDFTSNSILAAFAPVILSERHSFVDVYDPRWLVFVQQ